MSKTTTPAIATPLLDAAHAKHTNAGKRSSLHIEPRDTDQVAEYRQKVIQRWHAAKTDLATGLAEKRIYNVVFNEAKETINRQLGDCLEVAWEAFRKSHDLLQNRLGQYDRKWESDRASEQISSYINLNQAAGRIKRLQKYLDLPHVKSYVALLEEIVAINNVVQALKPFVVKGRRPAEKPVEVDLTNTATCAICRGTQKLTAELNMVHHGFRISVGNGEYLGYRDGSCFGVGYPPYEISCSANKAYLRFLEEGLLANGRNTLWIMDNKPDTHVEIEQERVAFRWVDTSVEHARGTPEYRRLRAELLRTLKGEKRIIENAIVLHEHAIKVWKRTATYDEVTAGVKP